VPHCHQRGAGKNKGRKKSRYPYGEEVPYGPVTSPEQGQSLKKKKGGKGDGGTHCKTEKGRWKGRGGE